MRSIAFYDINYITEIFISMIYRNAKNKGPSVSELKSFNSRPYHAMPYLNNLVFNDGALSTGVAQLNDLANHVFSRLGL